MKLTHVTYWPSDEHWRIDGDPLPPPEGQRWPNPDLHKDYYAKSRDGGYHEWISPEQYLTPGKQGDLYSPNGLDEYNPVTGTWTTNPNEKRRERQIAMTFRKEHER